MKKSILFLFVTFLTLGLTTSCSSDDDKGGDHASIVGKWKMYEIEIYIAGDEFSQTHEHECATKEDHVEFTSTHWTAREYDEGCIEEVESGTYVINGNKLVLTGTEEGDDYTETMEIVTLDHHTLKLKSEEIDEGETYTIYQTFKRM